MTFHIGDQVTVRTGDKTRYGVIVPAKNKNKVVPLGCYVVKLRSRDKAIVVHLDWLRQLVGPVRPQDELLFSPHRITKS